MYMHARAHVKFSVRLTVRVCVRASVRTCVRYLLLTLELAFHAFNSRHLPILHALRFEHLRESALAFLGDQTILCRGIPNIKRRTPTNTPSATPRKALAYKKAHCNARKRAHAENSGDFVRCRRPDEAIPRIHVELNFFRQPCAVAVNLQFLPKSAIMPASSTQPGIRSKQMPYQQGCLCPPIKIHAKP